MEQAWLFSPMATAVLRVREHMPDIDLFPVVMNGNNQSEFVTRNVKHGKFSYLVREGERDPQFDERGVIGFTDDAIPMAQRNPSIGMLPSELGQPFSCDDMQPGIQYLGLR
jgi:hypothetical protein